jgi:antitoxin component YwqK of YwqJK toxin-antitoxin module
MIACLAIGPGRMLTGEEVQEESKEEQVFVIKTLAELPQDYLRTDWLRGRFGPLNKSLEKLPDGYSMKVTLGSFYDFGNSASSGKLEWQPIAWVPVNPDGKEDGVEIRGRKRTPWKNGVKHGMQVMLRSGRTVEQIPWEDGVIEGVKKTFHKDGSIQSETPYVDGKQHGLSKTYAKDGRVTRTCMMKHGRRDGQLVDSWPDTGHKRRVINYADGKVEGTVRTYYPNGQLKQEIPFIDDTMHGEEKRYAEDGEPEKSRYWSEGTLVSKSEFMLTTE